MEMKKLLVILTTIATLLAVMGVVGAQDATATPKPTVPTVSTVAAVTPIRTVIQVVADETGLKPADITRQMAQGMTLADIIQANKGNVQTVIDQSVTEITDEINQAVATGKMTQDRANQILAALKDQITQGINGDLFPNKLDTATILRDSEEILLQATADATKLAPEDILKQVRAGKTLADVITANGASVDSVVSAAVTKATADINAAVKAGRLGQSQADTLIANARKVFTAELNGTFRKRTVQAVVGMAVLRLAAQQTGISVQDIIKEVRSGKSLADVLAEHNVDTTAFITSAVDATKKRLDQAVTNGRITQADADTRLQQFQQRLTEQINKVEGIEATPEATSAA
jgi:uncharacterized protein (DUF433 family)